MHSERLEKLNLFFTQYTLNPREFHAKRGMSHYSKLHERARILNRDFKYTARNTAKLSRLNDELCKIEINAWEYLKKLKREGAKLIKKNLLDDYMVCPKIEFYTKSKYYTKINHEMDGNFIFELNATFFGTKKNHFRNWNELRHSKDHPLAKLKMCYSFHCLFFDSHLAKSDLLRINDIWFDIEVTHQVLVKLN